MAFIIIPRVVNGPNPFRRMIWGPIHLPMGKPMGRYAGRGVR
jgi:hypothetical protein